MIHLLTALVLTSTPALVGDEERDKEDAVAQPIDFAKVTRTLGKTPAFKSQEPRFGLFLFGLNGEIRVWAALDQRTPGAEKPYDLLYIDRDADGDLADEEPLTGTARPNDARAINFAIGTFAVPGTEDVHQDFRLTSSDTRTSFKMKWRGEKISMGLYGPDSDAYGRFATEPKNAPLIIPGYDRPFTFEHWYSGTLQRGRSTTFKVFVGNRGDRTGHFTCVDDAFLPADEYPVATLIYHDGAGKERRHQVKLTERC